MALRIRNRSTGKIWTSDEEEKSTPAVSSAQGGRLTLTRKEPAEQTGAAAPRAGYQSRGGGFQGGSGGSATFGQVRQRREEQPSGLERVGLTVLSGLKGMGTDFASAATTLYESGQKNRDAQNQELLQQYQEELSRAQRDMETMREMMREDPETWGKTDLRIFQNAVDEAQRKVDAMTKVTGEKVQERATEAAHGAEEQWSASAAADQERAKEGLGTLGRIGVDAGVAGTQMLGDIGFGWVTGGGTKMAMAGRVFGGGTREARAEEANLGEQIGYGAASAAVAVLTEQLSNMAAPFSKAFGKGFADDMAEELIQKTVDKLAGTAVGKTALQALLRTGTSAAGEGLEEMVEDAINPVLKLIYQSDSRESALENLRRTYGENFDASEMLYDGLIGAILGGVGGTVDTAMNAPGNYRQYRRQAVEDAVGEINALYDAVRSPSDDGKQTSGSDMGGAGNAATQAVRDPYDITPRLDEEVKEPLKTGRVTTIYHPYQGKIPVQGQKNSASVHVGRGSVQMAEGRIEEARSFAEDAQGQGFKAALKNIYKSLFRPVKGVPVEGVTFEGKPYTVDINSNVPGKVISDRNLTAEKLALLDILPEVVRNGEYVGSGEYVQHGARNKPVIRYDYFETPVSIYGENYVVKFDVEVFPSSHNYRTHQIVNVGLTPTEARLAGPAPVPSSVVSSPHSDDSLPQGAGAVNGGRDPYDITPRLDEGGVFVPEANNNRDHQATKIDLREASGPDVGPVPTATAPLSDPVEGTRPLNSNDSLSQGAGAVNGGRDPYDITPRLDEGNKQSVGAAEKGFLGNTERGFSKNIRTDRSMEQIIREDFSDDPEMYFRLSNKKTFQKAYDIYSTGFENARSKLEQAIGSAKAGMKLAPEMVPLSRMVSNELARRGDEYSARQILTDISIELTAAGQLGQAANIMRDADPAAKVMMVEKMAKRISDSTGKPQRGGIKRDDAAGVVHSVMEGRADAAGDMAGALEDFSRRIASLEQQKGDAETLIREIYEEFSGRDNAKKSETRWVYQLARDLARNAANRASDKTAVRPVYSIMLGDLTSFMNQYVSKGKNLSPRRTAADTLADFFNNREEYAVAWNAARESIRQRYAGDPVMLDRLEDFLGGTMRYNATGTDAVMLRAVAEAALESDVSVKDMVLRGKYDPKTLSDFIAFNLITKTGAAGADADTITYAAQRYVNERARSAKLTAEEYIRRDIPAALEDIGMKLSDILTKGAKDKRALANQVATILTGDYGISREVAARTSDAIVEQFDALVRERSRARLESMFKERSARSAKTFNQKFDELMNLGAFSSEFNEAAVNKLFGLGGITVSSDLITEYANAETETEKNAVLDKIYQNIADQVPSSFMDKFNAIRYLNMLGNLKTQVRNIGGNTVMLGVRSVDTKLRAIMENAAYKLSGGKYQRTTTLFRDKGLYEAAKADFENFKSEALGEQKYSSNARGISSAIQDKRTIFKNNGTWGTQDTGNIAARVLRTGSDIAWSGLEAYRRATNWAMETGDVIFSKAAYADALARYLKANGVTAEQFQEGNLDRNLLDAARDYAIRTAQEATFRDNNAFSDMVSSIGFKNADSGWKKAANIALQGTLPFRKTPANVFVRAYEYSPAGMIDTAYKYVQMRKGNETITGADVISALSKAMTGTGLFLLGMALYDQGWLTAGKDKDDKQAALDSLTGDQEYALTLPNGTSFTLDWMSPAIMPMAIGAELMKAVGEDGYSLESAMYAFGGITNVMLNMSMLQGLNDQLSNVSYSDVPLVDLAINSLADFYIQGLTSTLMGQAERAFEDRRMTTYTDRNLRLPTDVQYTLGTASAKTPLWDYQQIPFIDEWGRTEESEPQPFRIFNQFVNPSYVSVKSETPLDEEIQRIYDATGNGAVVPSRSNRYITVNGERMDLSAEQYVQYARKRGGDSFRIASEMVENAAFDSLSYEGKSDALDEVYTYADAMAKAEISNYQPPAWMQKIADEDLDPVTVILFRAMEREGEGSTGNSGSSYQKYMEMISTGMPDKEKLKTLRAVMSESEYDKLESAYQRGITPEQYITFREETSGLSADKTLAGTSIPGSLKRKVLDYIDAIPNLNNAQKNALYFAAGYKESTLDDAPWYGRSERSWDIVPRLDQ